VCIAIQLENTPIKRRIFAQVLGMRDDAYPQGTLGVNDDAIAQKDKFDWSVFKLNGYKEQVSPS